MVHNLIDLGDLTGESRYLDRAERDLRAFAGPLSQQGQAMTCMAHALLRFLETAPQRLQRESEGDVQTSSTSETSPVQVTAEPTTLDWGEGSQTVRVHIKIGENYHINAHEPGDPALQPLRIELTGTDGLQLQVDYPTGETRTFPFADQPLYVHEGHVTVPVQIAKLGSLAEDAEPGLWVQYQPCSEQACLQPMTERIDLQVKSGQQSSIDAPNR
jgi:hypothetical protein